MGGDWERGWGVRGASRRVMKGVGGVRGDAGGRGREIMGQGDSDKQKQQGCISGHKLASL